MRTRPFDKFADAVNRLVEEYVPYYRPYYVVTCIGLDNHTHWEVRERSPVFGAAALLTDDDPGKFIARVDTSVDEVNAIVKMMNDQFNIDIRS